MEKINVTVNGGTSITTFYVAPPSRGIVVGLKAVFGGAVAANDTVDIHRGTTSVNLITTGATTAGIIYTGTRDTTNKELIFDPDDGTPANTVLKIIVSALPAANNVVDIEIEFDEFALK